MKCYHIKHWILLFILGFCVAHVFTLVQPQITSVSTTLTQEQTLSVIVDAGHGGFDGGATAYDLEEADINLAISTTLADLLTICGAEVTQTRTTDTALGADEGESSTKTADILARLAIFSADPTALVVSVHQNFYTDAQYSGAQMFYGVLNADSQALASSLQERFYQLQPDNTRQVAIGPDTVYLLQHTENPIVLAECGFLSNYEEAMLLTDPDYQTQVAVTLFMGIADYTMTNEVQEDESKEQF